MGEIIALALLVGIVVFGCALLLFWPTVDEWFMHRCPDCRDVVPNLVWHNLMMGHTE